MAAAAPQYPNYPLKEIPQPHPHDVLCGRGGGTNNHIGNSHWRMLVAANKQLYITLPKRQKMLLSRSIVNAVRSQNPPGRFLQKDSKSNQWFDVGDQRAQEKTSQALREGAPDIRKKVAEQTEKTDVKSTKNSTETPGSESAKTDQKKNGDKTSTQALQREQSTDATPVPATATSDGAVAAPGAPMMPTARAQVSGGNPIMQNPYMGQPGMVQGGRFPVNGGMAYPQGMAQPGQPGQPMVYYPGGNMAPMQLYPTMVLNDQGVMVPAMSVMPQHMQGMQAGMPPMMPPQQQVSGGGSVPTTNDFEPIPHRQTSENKGATPTFDEFMATPLPVDGGLEAAGLSFGSTFMDMDMKKLESVGTSFGSAMSYKPIPGNSGKKDDENVPQALAGLEPTGISFGDMSMMSVGTKKLEETGCSFGTMMSITKPDGLEAIGTSFGSLSLDPTNRETLFQTLELAAGGPEIPPMFNTEEKATGNLLECSDTESEDSESKYDLGVQKSAAWERMQSSVLQSQKSKGTVNSGDMMPPPVEMKGSVVSVTNLARDISAWSAADDFPAENDDDAALPPPPQQLEKQGSDGQKLEMYMIQQEKAREQG